MVHPPSFDHQQRIEALASHRMAHQLTIERLLSKTTTQKQPPELSLQRFLHHYFSGKPEERNGPELQRRLDNNFNRWKTFKAMANAYQRIIAEYPKSKAAASNSNTIPRHTLEDGDGELCGEKSTNGEHFIIVKIRRFLDTNRMQLVVEPADHGESHANHYLLQSVGVSAEDDGSTVIQFITTEDTPLFRLLMDTKTTAYLLS